MVVWWECVNRGFDDGDNFSLTLLIEPRRGFIANISTIYTFRDVKALIDGPYSRDLRLDSYSRVLLFATRIGIAS
jgi:hypothetical protein